MNKVIVTTTINPITEAIQKFSQMEGWSLVIAGDLKTPDYNGIEYRSNHHFLTPSMQEAMDAKLSEAIGWNCIQRRNFAFLFACKELKADILASIDDDNIPLENWGKEVNVGSYVKCVEYHPTKPAFDPLMVTRHCALWHRGFPIELVKTRSRIKGEVNQTIKCDVQADLWNGEADVDSVCRLTQDSSNCRFDEDVPLFTSSKPSPFNSQNTFLSREVMPHYFMFPGVGRYDDICASYHVQAQGFRVMYGGPTVVQKRNEHNILTDMTNELWGMHNALGIVKEVPTNKNAVLDRLPPRSLEAFRLYQKHFE